MKRSDMVRKIKIHLANQFDLIDSPEGYFDLDYEASLLLTIIESQGMPPPMMPPTDDGSSWYGVCYGWESEDGKTS